MQTLANIVQSRMGTRPTLTSAAVKPRPDGSTMRALVWFGPRDLRLTEVPVPDITEPDDVIVRVTGTTICGSDLHLYHGEVLAMKKGDILGHEFLGRVDRIGPNVRNLKIDQRVVASFQIACGKCRYCKEKLSSFCDNTNPSSLQEYLYGTRDAGFFGYSHLTGGFAGGQAEYVRVPFGEVNLLPVPDDVPDEKALYLSDVLPTSYHCVEDTGVKEGDTVGIWGLGPIGLLVAKWCKLKGVSRIIAIDRVPERLEFAREKLGCEVIDFSKESDVSAKVHELVSGGLDVALDCGSFHEPKSLLHKSLKFFMLESDVPETLNEMIVSVRKMGRCGIIGVYMGYTCGFNIGALMEKGVRFIGNGQAPVHRYWDTLLHDYLQTGKFDPTFVVSHRIPLDDMPKLYAAFDKRVGGVKKVFVETRFSAPPHPGTPALTRVDDWGKEMKKEQSEKEKEKEKGGNK